MACGVVLTGITRRQFDELGLGAVIGPQLVICQDEMTESARAIDFEARLRAMFAHQFGSRLERSQVDRVRWHLFPEIRIPQVQLNLFNETQDIEKVMDLQQEQLARSLGDGHRVIHGVAGSGKTMILGYRAEHPAKATLKPILVLCFNRVLSKRLSYTMSEKGLQGKVHVRTFHQWCSAMLKSAGIPTPSRAPDDPKRYAELVDSAVRSAATGRVKPGQYDAIFIDEAHDFEPEWLRLVTRLLNPATNSLLVLYDDAQSIYAKARRKFSFKSVGIQAAGRTTILRVNYRNTQEIVAHTVGVVRDLLKPRDSDDDGVPLIAPIGGGRHGPQPTLVEFSSPKEEAEFICDRFRAAHQGGMPWNQMAMIYRSGGLPVTFFKDANFSATEDTIKVLNMHVCKGLEFRLVAIPGADALRLGSRDEDDDARLFYVAMTRATHELIICRSRVRNATG